MALAFGAIQVIILGFIIGPFPIAALALRLWSRRIQKQTLRFNDYMAVIATILAVGTVSICLAEAFIGAVGEHIADILATRPRVLDLFLKWQVVWAAANTSVKLSILSLYTVLFPSKRFVYFCYGTITIAMAYFLSVLLEGFLLCTPVAYNWDKTIPGGECHHQILAYLIAGSTNLIIDAWVVALPMPMLFGLRMSLLKKLGVASMFSLGILICILSLLRVISILSWDMTDATYTTTGVALYSILEPTLGVVNACLPTIKPALIRISKSVSRSPVYKTKSLPESRRSRTAGGCIQPPESSNMKYNGFERLGDSIPLTDSWNRPNLGDDSGKG
ncbi:hypothetical protein F5Y05DRAFT_422792 [Hypoxylon sp. FL0543]|nr:hypothetical protein F5Y05DRAFT_422792 [Hypoxylon sp. FL0543]